MAFDYVLVLLLAYSAFSAHCRLMEQDAVGTDSFPMMADIANEAVPYKVIETKDAYEIHDYEKGDFAATVEFQSGFTISYTKGLSYLNAYFLGRNKDNVRMDRTVPFWTKLYNDKEYKTTNRTYQHAFYIPSKYQGKTPEPTSDKVRVVRVPGGRGYTRQFSGFATEGKALEEALRLHDALLADDVSPGKSKRQPFPALQAVSTNAMHGIVWCHVPYNGSWLSLNVHPHTIRGAEQRHWLLSKAAIACRSVTLRTTSSGWAYTIHP
ncbi:hypothetical protein CVIRNUC_007490 [Coccomyxa viridis]|uniref:Extracellular protein n=1 Tax=Coccomyxa viridis TaxID=1274662 RepID=A0AAV1IBP7_9CHLO|nr:hypothetical protein CVIRNUC_007490 [Coccomyxa viridis]